MEVDPVAPAYSAGEAAALVGAAFGQRLAINIPDTISIPALQAVLGPTDGTSNITEERIRAPDEALLLHIYSTLLTIPALHNAVAAHEKERKERERQSVEMETQLHDAERSKAEAEARAEEDRKAKEEALRERMEMSGQLANVQGTLAALQSSVDSGVVQAAEVKGRIEQVESEKRGVLEMLERESVESARRAEEIATLTTRARDARNEVNRLINELQEAKSAEGTAKFKIQSLEQELNLKSNDARWAHQELTKVTEELAQFRVRTHGELSTLATQLQQQTQAAEAYESKVSALQAAYDDVQARLEEATREKAELRQRLVEQEGAFKVEMGTQQRLSDLMQQQKDKAEHRLADIEEQWEKVLMEHRDREDALRQELAEQEDIRKNILSEKDEIQQALDRLAESVGIDVTSNYLSGQAENGDASEVGSVAGLSTPKSRALNLFSTSAVMSPTAALAAKVQKSGKSFTQVYAELARTEEELRREKIENRRLAGVLEQIMADIRDRAPILQAQREEMEQLQRHTDELSSFLANACQERDYSEREAKDQRLRADATDRENNLLNQQVSDLARQVRDLSRELILRDDPSAAAQLEPDGASIGDVTKATLESVSGSSSSDTQTIITEQLVSFRTLSELVTQNSRLLRVVRQLGAEMEQSESNRRANYESQESEAISEAKQVIIRLQEDLRAERTRADGIRRERDMFRTMTAQGGASSSNAVNVSLSGSETNASNVALTNQYSQLQAQFEAFRSETANDMERLKEEAYQARSEANKGALQAAKEKASRESIEERLANAQQTYSLERKELRDLQQRYNSLQESLARQEISAQTISQQLITAHANVERLRNEVSNLNAERKLHKETTDRLMDEKEASVRERSNLSELLRSAQTMQADLEKASGETRRRLEAQVERLEEQNRELSERATKAEEAHRQMTLRRDVETTDLRTKLERVTEDLSKAKEELAVVKTSLHHLTTRNEDLQKQVDSKDEKLAVYERRTLSGVAAANADSAADLNREQQLQIELADVKGELRSAQVEAEQARAHAEQFKSIATANEEALAQLQSSYDQYKATTDAGIAQKESELTILRERSGALVNELNTAQNELSSERKEREQQAEIFRSEQKTLEDALSEVTAVEDRARITRESMHEEVRRHAQLTQEAHARYESELLAHAEDVKALTSVKEQLDRARTQLLEAQKARETAEGNLASSTDSWTRQRELLEREKEEVKQIVQELRGQNKALHDHLETLQQQASEIRQSATLRTSEDQTNVGDVSLTSQAGNDELHEVIRYLRREKEIVDLQIELREQESARLRQSVEFTQRSLDEARLQLSQERERNAGASTTAQQHQELMEKINQLNILRESNTTLRDETERAQRKVQTLEAKIESLTREIEPIREELRVKAVELEACQRQLALSQEDCKRWQGRTQSILQQYNRVDPDELKALQEAKEAAEKALQEQKAVVEQHVQDLETSRKEVENKQSQFDRLRQQSIERIKGLNQKVAEMNAETAQLKTKQGQDQSSTEEATERLSALQSELESLKAEKEALESNVAGLEQQTTELNQTIEELNAQLANPTTSAPEDTQTVVPQDQEEAVRAALEEAQKGWDAERTALEEKHKVTERREQMHLQKAKEFNTSMKNAIKERDALLKEKEEREQAAQTNEDETLQSQEAAQETTSGAESAEMVALRERIASLEQELERANARIAELEAGGAVSESSQDVARLRAEHDVALREQEARLSTQYMERQKQAVEIAVQKTRAAGSGMQEGGEGVEEQVQARLKEFEDRRQIELQSAVAAKEQELRSAFEEQLKARYEAGKEEVTLRNRLLLKTKENKIEKLTAELNALKGIAPASTATATDGAAATPKPTPVAVRGGTPARPIARPVAPQSTGQPAAAAARGGAPVRGTGRGGAPGAGGAKRKLETGDGSAPADGTTPTPAGATLTANEQPPQQAGSLPKKPRPTPVAVRGGAGGQRGGAAARGGNANRGGRGGQPQQGANAGGNATS